jgi:hypothetical protein
MFKGRFIQTKQGMSASYEMYLENALCATAEIPHDIENSVLYFSADQGDGYELRPSSVIALKKQGLQPYAGAAPYEIVTSSGESCGYIFERKTAGFFKGYVYDQILFRGKNYTVYIISIPKEGKKYAIYRSEGQEQQVALVEKPEIVYNRLDEYSWMALYKQDIEVLGLYLLYEDYLLNAPHRMETVTASKELSSGKTLNKELLGKYNEQFKKR